MAAFDRRTLGIGVAVWLLVVVVVSAATWTVIDAAGSDVSARPSSDPAAASDDLTSDTPVAKPPGTVTPRPSRTPKPSRTATPRTSPPAATVSPEVTETSPATPEPEPAPTRTPSPTRKPPSSSPPPPPPAPTARERTWAGEAGTVTVSCTGARISLVSATPANGWRQAVDERGPDRVRVRYREADARSGPEDESEGGDDQVDVRAQCAGGTPRFSVDS